MYQTSHSYNSSPFFKSNNPSRSLEYITSSSYSSSSNTYHAAVSSHQPYSLTAIFQPQSSFHPEISYHTQTIQLYTQSQQNFYAIFNQKTEYHFQPDNFLKPGKEGIFVGATEEIKEYIEDTFKLIFHKEFPKDIKISICNKDQFRKIAPHESTIGLSINRRKQNLLSEIFVLNDSLARVMLTIGHELGHVLTETLNNAHDEEAKAYAFSLAWIKTIKQHNIANLKEAIITESPAHNGLHNIAFSFVSKLIEQGKNAWETYQELIQKTISLRDL